MTKSVRVSEEESACVRGRMRCCQLTDLCADCSLLRSCLCSHLSHQAFQRVSFLYFLALAHLAWQPSCWQVLDFLVLFFFFVIFVNAGTWIHCVLGDVLHCLTLLIQEKKNTILSSLLKRVLRCLQSCSECRKIESKPPPVSLVIFCKVLETFCLLQCGDVDR